MPVCCQPHVPAQLQPGLPSPASPCQGLCGQHLAGLGLSGCLHRAEPQCLPGWQTRRRAWSHPPATSPTEALPSPACAAASSVEPARLRSRLLLRQRVGLGPGSPPQLGGVQPRPQSQPLPSLVAALAPASKSGADVEAVPGACLRLGAGSIGVAPFLPRSPLPWPRRFQEELPMPRGGQGWWAKLLLVQPPGWVPWCPAQRMACVVSPRGAAPILAPCTPLPVPAGTPVLAGTASMSRGSRAAAGTRHGAACSVLPGQPQPHVLSAGPSVPKSVGAPVLHWGLGQSPGRGVPVLQPPAPGPMFSTPQREQQVHVCQVLPG